MSDFGAHLRTGGATSWVVAVRCDVLGIGEVDIGERATMIARQADDTVGIKVAVELVASAASAAKEEEERGEDGGTCETSDDSAHYGTCMRRRGDGTIVGTDCSRVEHGFGDKRCELGAIGVGTTGEE